MSSAATGTINRQSSNGHPVFWGFFRFFSGTTAMPLDDTTDGRVQI